MKPENQRATRRFFRSRSRLALALAALLCAAGPFEGLTRGGVFSLPVARAAKAKKPAGPLAVFRARVRREMKRHCVRPGRIGVQVRSITAARTLFSHRAATPRTPASNVKLLTVAAALAHLGPDYRFATDFYAAARPSGGVVEGDLYLKGYGDPHFVQEKMRDLVRRLKLRGVSRVEGDLVADDSFFDDKRHGRGWPLNGSIRPYLAPHGALSLNFNLAGIVVTPGDAAGSAARALLEPPSGAIGLRARVRTTRRGRASIKLGRSRAEGKDLMHVSGTFPARGAMRIYRVPVTDPPAFTAGAVAAELARQGIVLTGRTRKGKTPADVRLLARNLSPPLGEVVRGLNKFSNNFVGEQVLKTLGAEARGAPGTAKKGLAVVRDWLLSIGVRAEDFALADGSGLSRSNRISPRALVTLLEAAHNDFRLRPEFVASLGVFGIDGTVRERGRPRDARRVRVKTGMLAGVNAMSGYAAAKNGETLAFSVLINANACRPEKFTDALVRAMVSFSRPLPGPAGAWLGGARKMMARPMPEPYVRDGWRRRAAPRPEDLSGQFANGGGGAGRKERGK